MPIKITPQEFFWQSVKHEPSGSLIPASNVLMNDKVSSGTTSVDGSIFNLGSSGVHSSSFYYEKTQDLGQDVNPRIWGTITAEVFTNSSGSASPTFGVDYRLSTGVFDGYETWSIASANAQFVNARGRWGSTVGVKKLSMFSLALDFPTQFQGALAQIPTSTGVDVVFDPAFLSTPTVTLTPQSTASQAATYSGLSSTAFHINLFTSTGGASTGSVSWRAEGI